MLYVLLIAGIFAIGDAAAPNAQAIAAFDSMKACKEAKAEVEQSLSNPENINPNLKSYGLLCVKIETQEVGHQVKAGE